MMGVGVTLCIIGLICIAISLLLPSTIDSALMKALQDVTMLDTKESLAYSVFANNSEYPIGLSVYFMNLTNPDEVLQGGIPELQEIGPYNYKEYRVAYNVSWDDQHTTLSYRYYTTFQFDEETSASSDSDVVINWNPNVFPFWFVYKQVGPLLPTLGQKLYEGFQLPEYSTDESRAFMKRSLREYIFGYPNDPLLALLAQEGFAPSPDYSGVIRNFTSFEDFNKNAKQDAMRTGYPEIRDLRKVVLSQDSTTVCEDSDEMIDGTDGGAFPRPVKRTDRPKLFAASFYRNVELEYVGDSEVYGVKTLRFILPESMWRNSPENQEKYSQIWNGAVNVTACTKSIPTLLTRPRFGKGRNPSQDFTDPALIAQSNVKWLDDNVATDTYFDIEPITGGSMNISSSSQAVWPFDVITVPDANGVSHTFLQNIRPMNYVPVFWARQFISVSTKDAADFRSNVYGMMDAEEAIFAAGLSLGILLCVIAAVVLNIGYGFYYSYKNRTSVVPEFDSVANNYAKVGEEAGTGPEPVHLDQSTSFARHGGATYGSTVYVKNPFTGETMPLSNATMDAAGSYSSSNATYL